MNTHQDPYLFDDEAENHRIGKKLHNRNLSHREGYRPGHSDQSNWDEGNHFHTGPSERGSRQYERQHRPQRHQNVHQHYANRPDSSYRHPESKINFGDRHQQTSYDRYKPYYSDPSHFRSEPSDRDIYKANDYRYRSGRYNWNAVEVNPERTDDYDAGDRDRSYEGHRMHYYEGDRGHDEGFFSRITHGIKDAWHTVTHRHPDDYRSDPDHPENRSGYKRHQDSDDHFRRGYESGPRWADEHRHHPDSNQHNQSARNRWPEDPQINRRGQKHGYNPDPNNNW